MLRSRKNFLCGLKLETLESRLTPAAGDLDTSFGTGGIATNSVLVADQILNNIAIQADGKIVAVGYYNITSADGTLASRFAVARYNSDGSLDSTFSGDGKVDATFPNSATNIAYSVVIQSDGKVVVAGMAYDSATLAGANQVFAVARFNTNGTPDTTFDADGFQSFAVGTGGSYATAIAIQADGKIVLVGQADGGTGQIFAVARLNTTGSLDTTFDTDGKATLAFGTNDTAATVAMQTDGKILVGGSVIPSGQNQQFGVARLNSNGGFDTSFGTGGKVVTASGGTNVIADTGRNLLIQTDGKIILTGYSLSDSSGTSITKFAAVRYSTAGVPDTKFGADGTGVVTYGSFLGTQSDAAINAALLSNGKIVLVGSTTTGGSTGQDFSALRLSADGSIDTTFAAGKYASDFVTVAITNSSDVARGVAIQADGKIIIGGESNYGPVHNFALTRVATDGTIDTAFQAKAVGAAQFLPGRRADFFALGGGAIRLASGKILVGGNLDISAVNRDFGVVQLNADGSLDTSFGWNGVVHTPIVDGVDTEFGIVLQPDGKFLIAGQSLRGTTYTMSVVRYNANGSLDTTFGTNGIFNSDLVPGVGVFVYDIALQADGKIVLSGYERNSNPNSSGGFIVIRLTSAGALDLTFNSQGYVLTDVGGIQDVATSLAVQSDGSIVVAGYYSTDNSGHTNLALARYSSSGLLDPTFGTSGIVKTNFDNIVSAWKVHLLSDGKILVVGYSVNADNVTYTAFLAKYLPNGALDTTFGAGTGYVRATSFGDLYPFKYAIQSDGKIVIVGINLSSTGFVLGRFNADGSIDTTFGTSGKVTTTIQSSSNSRAIILQPDGKILAIGRAYDGNYWSLAVTRYLNDPTPTNTPPTLTSPGNKSLNELAPLTFTLSATDPDAGDTKTFSILTGSQTGMKLNSTSGAFSWTPTEAQDGNYTVTFRVTDGAGATNDKTITITVSEVNVAPVLTSPGNKSIPATSLLTFTLAATDPDVIAGTPDTKSYSIVSGLLTGMTLNAQSGVFSWTPTTGQVGSHPITFRVTDKSGATNDQIATVQVTAVNHPPVLSPVGNKTGLEGSPLTFSLSANDPDTGDVVTYSASSLLPGMNLNPTTGLVTWTPSENQDGTVNITFRATDSAGLFDQKTFQFAINEVNVPPTLSIPGSRTGKVNEELSFILATTDPDIIASTPDSVIFTIVAGQLSGMTLNSTTGAFAWTPAASQVGTHSIVFRATDRANAFVEATVELRVSPDAPPLNKTIFVGGREDGTVIPLNTSGAFDNPIAVFPGKNVNVRTTSADMNGDGAPELIAGTGSGTVTEVVVMDGKSGAVLGRFNPFESSFTGGVFVATGDLDGDGLPEVVVSPDQGGGPVVAIYSGASITQGNPQEVVRFFGIQDPNFRGGARLAVGDVDGDGTTDVVVAAGFLGGPRVTIWSGHAIQAGQVGENDPSLANFFAFESGLRNGCYPALGDFDGDGRAELIFGAGPGGGPRVRIASSAAILQGTSIDDSGVADFFAGDSQNRGGVRLTVKDVDNDLHADLVTGSGEGEMSRIRIYTSSALLTSPSEPPPFRDPSDPFGELISGGVFVG